MGELVVLYLLIYVYITVSHNYNKNERSSQEYKTVDSILNLFVILI